MQSDPKPTPPWNEDIRKLHQFIEDQFCRQAVLLQELTRPLRFAHDKLAPAVAPVLRPPEGETKDLDVVSETSGAGINIRHIERHPGTVLASGGRTEKAEMQSETSLNNSAAASVAAEVAEARNKELGEADTEKRVTLSFQMPEDPQDVQDLAAFDENWEPTARPSVTESPAKRSRDSSRQTFVRAKLSQHQEKAAAAARLVRQASAVKPKRCRPSAKQVVMSRVFAYGIICLIIVNLVLLGIEVDISAGLPQNEVPTWFAIVNIIIVSVYTLEIALKIVAFGAREFFRGKDRYWNVFDFVIVSVSIGETLIEMLILTSSSVDSAHLRVLRFLRVARALRSIRVMRLVHYIGALRTLVFSIVSTMGSLLWTMLLLVMIFYLFGVILAQIATDNCRTLQQAATGDINAVPVCEGALYVHWRTVPVSMLTLFMAVSGGLSWTEALQPLQQFSPFGVACVIIYIVITVFAVLNVVTGVFCNTAIESAHADKDIAIMKQMNKRNAQIEALRHVFGEIDRDRSNKVSIQELKDAMDTQKLSSFMESLGISTEDVWTLFMVIDSDESGEITLDEFVGGCMTLNGPARSLHLARMSHENKEIKQLSAQMAGLMSFLGVDRADRKSVV